MEKPCQLNSFNVSSAKNSVGQSAGTVEYTSAILQTGKTPPHRVSWI